MERPAGKFAYTKKERDKMFCLALFGKRKSAIMVKESLIAIPKESRRYVVVALALNFIARWNL
jgi:hypothetical protein